jgi:hypothetical protein
VSDDSEAWYWAAANWTVDDHPPSGGPCSTKDDARKAAQSYYDDAKRTGRKVRCRGGRIVAVTLHCPSTKTEVYLKP